MLLGADITLCGIRDKGPANVACKWDRNEQTCKALGPQERWHVRNHKLCSLQLFVKRKKKLLLTHGREYFLLQLSPSRCQISPGNVQFSGNLQLFLWHFLQFIKQSLDMWFISFWWLCSSDSIRNKYNTITRCFKKNLNCHHYLNCGLKYFALCLKSE